ncbi:hypothetical protein NGRA_2864 [Nosema granulosis]|uniref:RNA-directed DNA polymerase from mobile element jockey n=1 Tax=Nosema granulosis TaxID=83296 RepID=A0A9P6GVT1_9MICR|nr:hypothetical protein NGRA_2864 [Nosema granulosis]
MHIGPHNLKHEYSMSGKKLVPVTEEVDLGVIICNDLKSSKQCNDAAKKDYKMRGMMFRIISYKNQLSKLKLFIAFVRPHLEYAVHFWSPFLRKDVIKLEKFQRRATKLIPSLRNKR